MLAPELFILTGPIHSGKTSLLDALTREAGRRAIPIQGYLSPAVWDEAKHIGYDLLTLPDRESFPFLRKEGLPAWQSVGPYFLTPEALVRAQGIIRAGAAAPFLIVDEVGPLELEGKGVWPALAELLGRAPRKLILTVRSGLLDSFVDLIPGAASALIVRVGDEAALATMLA